jgi:hypothetical protein
MAVLAAAELAAVVGQQGVDLGSVRLKGRQHIIVISWTAVTGSLLG